jgi:penicillin-binding protein 1A
MLQDVVNRGTGYSIRRDYRCFLPVGGKTGTTNDYTDTWFIGFTPNLVAGLWLGFDDAKVPLAGETGATAALPFWARFITVVYDSLDLLRSQFETSPNVIKVKVCKDTKKLITPYCPSPIEDIFNVKYMPKETCEIHKGLHPVTRERKKPF